MQLISLQMAERIVPIDSRKVESRNPSFTKELNLSDENKQYLESQEHEREVAEQGLGEGESQVEGQEQSVMLAHQSLRFRHYLSRSPSLHSIRPQLHSAHRQIDRQNSSTNT